MIVRTWRCRATHEGADAYERYITGTVFTGLTAIDGHRGAYLLRRALADSIEFVAVSFWETTEAIKEYAGDDIGLAMVKPEARAMLVDFDPFVEHFDLVHDTVRLD